jgi:cytochrome c peroxidase
VKQFKPFFYTLPLLFVIGWGFWSYLKAPVEEAHADLLPQSSALLASNAALALEPIRPMSAAQGLDAKKVALGEKLFHDPRLSADNTLSCASCHPLARGGADGLPVSIGVGGALGGINAPSVLTAAYNFRQFWDGRAGSLEEQAGGPVVNPIEMASTWPQVLEKLGADPEIKQQFSRVYRNGLTADNIRDALAEFERSLARPSRFDRWLSGDTNALSNDEVTGYQLFRKHGCSGCHQGINIGGNLYQRFGTMAPYFSPGTSTKADMGRFNVTGREEDRHYFKVPSLRNVALTAPYFHNAAAATLEEAVRVMGRYQLGLELPAQDVEYIVQFLGTLNSELAP